MSYRRPHTSCGADGENRTPRVVPRAMWLLLGILGLESLCLFVLGIVGLRAVFAQEMSLSISQGIFLVVLVFLLSGGLCTLGVFFLRGKRWPRALCCVWQLLLVALMAPFIFSAPWLALIGVSVPLAGLIVLFHPAVTAHTVDERYPPGLS